MRHGPLPAPPRAGAHLTPGSANRHPTTSAPLRAGQPGPMASRKASRTRMPIAPAWADDSLLLGQETRTAGPRVTRWLHDNAPPQQAGGASSYQVLVHAGPPPEQADGGPHLSRTPL